MSLKICVACKTIKGREAFDKTSDEFPTRDGLKYCCRECRPGPPAWRVEATDKGRRLEPAGEQNGTQET